MMAIIGFAVVLLLGIALVLAALYGAAACIGFAGKIEPALALPLAAGCALIYYACTHAPFAISVAQS